MNILTHSELTGQLVTLCDGRRGLRTGLTAEIREAAPAPGQSPAVLDFIASSAVLDRCGEIIDPLGWQLENYRRNPVFQNAHQYGDIIFTLGKALLTEVRAGAPTSPHAALRTPHLFQRIEFAVEANPMARIAYGLYKGKFLNAVSVGFVPLRWANADGTEHTLGRAGTPLPVEGRAGTPLPVEGRAGTPLPADSSACPGAQRSARPPAGEPPFRRKYLAQELLEVSAVGIPANPEALQLGLKAGAVQKADLQELVELMIDSLNTDPLITDFPGFTAGTVANPGARGDGADGAQLLELARALRKLLRRA